MAVMDYQQVYESIKNDDDSIKDLVGKDHANDCFPEGLDFLPTMLKYSPPLISIAAYHGSINAYKYFLSIGSNITELDCFSTPISYFSIVGGNKEIMEDLFTKEIDFSGSVFVAIENGNLDSLIWLKEKNLITKHEQDMRGYSIGLYAILTKNPQLIDFCFKQLNEIPRVNATGNNILIYLLKGGFKDAVKEVVKKYPTLATTPGKNGITPVRLAQMKKYNDLEEILCQKTNTKYQTPKKKEKTEKEETEETENKDPKSVCCLLV
ncbi:hypothetical protein TVAG_367480 [Trichomonas vaginalis G3]|uniref:DUF3447 domain-containing protein n=1 Tax=Trichomonas vaginalis (strain ATCC PRA-98 / G3) TaxID=412133 RepID=A2F5Q5_TRIV3|nr:Ankyrin repeat family [Trichomonas vaginalis G3]EAX99755.1 hypothetical protein TVAG_367480 [Trichomonas vaginalis G3]KAI5489039.1 Ankyrin repeat family [Trichomonas vaginalis G3]|eukprot:XP_001312685.1 hypothetical protein [Trichomonas vaginalis G3]